jgi:uncharacterized membrane protein
VTILKRKFLLMLMAVALYALTFTTPVKAAASIATYGYVDKTQYKPGDTGTLKIWIINDGDEDIILKSVTIKYPWNAFYIWEGNETIKQFTNPAVLQGENWSTSRTFTVPTDGRAIGGYISVQVVTDKVTSTPKLIPVNVASAPTYGSLQDMDKLVTLFTVMAVLLIVCTIIIAATIFLSTRKPQVTWKAEEKTQ